MFQSCRAVCRCSVYDSGAQLFTVCMTVVRSCSHSTFRFPHGIHFFTIKLSSKTYYMHSLCYLAVVWNLMSPCSLVLAIIAWLEPSVSMLCLFLPKITALQNTYFNTHLHENLKFHALFNILNWHQFGRCSDYLFMIGCGYNISLP
jgi:hypothetical protein